MRSKMPNMSNSLVRELFRNLEMSIHERLAVLEELIGRNEDETTPQEIKGTIEDSLQITRMDPALQERLATMDTTLRELFTIQKTLSETVKESKRREQDMVTALQSRIEILEARISVSEPAVDEVQGDIVTEEEEDAPVIAEAEAADVDEDENENEDNDDDGEEDEEEEEEEGGGLEGEEFTYKGDVYFRGSDNKVYIPDEDGAVDPDSPVGLWVPNPKFAEGGKITRLT